MSGSYPSGPSRDWKKPGSPFYEGIDSCHLCDLGESECHCDKDHRTCGECRGEGDVASWQEDIETYSRVLCSECAGEGRIQQKERLL